MQTNHQQIRSDLSPATSENRAHHDLGELDLCIRVSGEFMIWPLEEFVEAHYIRDFEIEVVNTSQESGGFGK